MTMPRRFGPQGLGSMNPQIPGPGDAGGPGGSPLMRILANLRSGNGIRQPQSAPGGPDQAQRYAMLARARLNRRPGVPGSRFGGPQGLGSMNPQIPERPGSRTAMGVPGLGRPYPRPPIPLRPPVGVPGGMPGRPPAPMPPVGMPSGPRPIPIPGQPPMGGMPRYMRGSRPPAVFGNSG